MRETMVNTAWFVTFVFTAICHCETFAYLEHHTAGADSQNDWLASEQSNHVFVLFTENESRDENPNVGVFIDVAGSVQARYHSSMSFAVRDNIAGGLPMWDHDCPTTGADCLVSYEKVRADRTCLMTPAVATASRVPTTFRGNLSDTADVEHFLLIQSLAFTQHITGDASLLDLLYALPTGQSQVQCAEVNANAMDFETFVHRYWLPQKPVVIKNVKSFSGDYILRTISKYRDVTVGAKLSPEVEFEGVDSLLNWEMAGEQDVPKKVLSQLQSPDKVVVRAAHEDMALGRVLGLLTKSEARQVGQHRSRRGASTGKKHYSSHENQTNVYVEYMPLDSVQLSPLYNELLNVATNTSRVDCGRHTTSCQYPGFPAWMDALRDGTPYLWLGDGLAVGKMHFDPYDNLLLQLEGSKSFKLIDTSDNQRMYEGHMREAQLEARLESSQKADLRQYSFRKRKLLESTSMVHTPVTNVEQPDTKSFPRAKNIPSVECKVNPGDMLFVPSFWWHEVTSSPGSRHDTKVGSAGDYLHLNVAINHWFDPLYLKEYPCASCRKYPNKNYGSFLLNTPSEPSHSARQK